MKKIYLILPLALALCFVVGCQDKEAMAELEEFKAQAEVEETGEAALREAMVKYSQIVANGDFEAWLDFCTDDITVMWPEQPIFKGRDTLRKNAEKAFDTWNYKEQISIEQVGASREWGFVVFTRTVHFIPKAGGETIEQDSKGIFIFKRTAEGSWKVATAIYNRDAPRDI